MPASPFQLRLAQGRDIYEIAVMSRCLIEVGLRGWTWHPARVARALRTRETCVLVAETRGHLAGFAIAEFGDIKAHLSLLAVKPTHQRCGIGLALLDWMVESGLVAGVEYFTVEMRANNFAARNFYESASFGRIEYIPGYYQNVEAALRMRRDIRQPALPRAFGNAV